MGTIEVSDGANGEQEEDGHGPVSSDGGVGS